MSYAKQQLVNRQSCSLSFHLGRTNHLVKRVFACTESPHAFRAAIVTS